MKFEYNPAKSLANKSKHGLDFEEAKALWDDENLLVFPLRFEDEPASGVWEASTGQQS